MHATNSSGRDYYDRMYATTTTTHVYRIATIIIIMVRAGTMRRQHIFVGEKKKIFHSAAYLHNHIGGVLASFWGILSECTIASWYECCVCMDICSGPELYLNIHCEDNDRDDKFMCTIVFERHLTIWCQWNKGKLDVKMCEDCTFNWLVCVALNEITAQIVFSGL